MDLPKTIKQAFEVVKLNESAMKKVAADKNALNPALIIVGLVAVVGALGYYIFPSSYAGYVFYRPDVAWLLGHAVWSFVLSLASLYLIGYLGVALFKSKLDMTSYVKVMGYGSIVGLVSVFPRLTFIGSIWGLVILWKILSKLGKLEVAEIIVLLVLDVVAIGVLSFAGLGFMF